MKRFVAFIGLAVLLAGCMAFPAEKVLAAEVVWKIQTTAFPVNGRQPQYQAIEFLKEEIYKATDGKYDLELYHSGQLGGERDNLEGTQMGTYKIAMIMGSYFNNISEPFKAFEFPYLFEDYDHYIRVIKSDVGKEILGTLENHGLVGLAFGINGIFHISNSVRPITKADDLKGLKFRCQDAPMEIEAVNMLGGLGIPMAWSEVYTGLQQKTVDGLVTQGAGYSSIKVYELNKYLTKLGIFYVPSAIIANKEYWESLPADDREKIQGAVDRAMDRHLADWLIQDAESYETCAAGGMEILTEYDRASFENVLKPMYEKYDAQFGDLIRRIRALGKAK